MSRSAALHVHKDKAFSKMLQTFTSICHKDGFHPPGAVIEELFFKIGRPDATLQHTKLHFKDFNIDDQLLSYVMDALAVYPVVEEIDLSENCISDTGAKYLLKLLRAQANLVKNVHIDKRLYATFISHVDLSDNGGTVSAHISDEINMMCEALDYANVQTSVRKAFLNNGCRHYVTDSVMKSVWNDVIKEHFPSLQSHLAEQEILQCHYASTTRDYTSLQSFEKRALSPTRSVGSSSQYNVSICSTNAAGSKLPVDIAEVAVMRGLQASDRAPYLTRWQYSMLAVPEVRSDESLCDKSLLYTSTVFSQMEDTLSVSNSNIQFSPAPKGNKLSGPESVSSAIEANAMKLYRMIDRQEKGYFTAAELQAALEFSSQIVDAFMFYMTGDGISHDKDDISTLDSASLFSLPDESKHLVRLMDIKNTGRVTKKDFISFVTKSAGAVGSSFSVNDLSGPAGYENASPNQTPGRPASVNVTFSEVGSVGGGAIYTGHYSSSQGGATNASVLVSDLMQAFLDRVKIIGSRENMEDLATFHYDKSKEDDIIRLKEEKAENFCKEYCDASNTEMETLSIPMSLDYGEYSELRMLYLRDNKMTSVDGSVLGQLRRLRVLDLSHNEIRTIHGKPFPKSIRSLNLSYNLLTDTHFSPLIQSVTELNLAGNQIRNIDVLPQKIAKLNISDNKISSVLSLRVMALYRITSLAVRGNPIVDTSKFLKATISSLFPGLEELDGAMLPRRVNSRIVRRASSTMSLSIQGESRGRRQMTQTYQKQLDKKRCDEYKEREELRKEKLEAYVNSFNETMKRKKEPPQKLEAIINRLYNGKHNSMAHQRGRTQRAGSADSARSGGAERVPKRNRTSLSPSKIQEMTTRLYNGVHHRTAMGPPREHPSSPRRYSSSSPTQAPRVMHPFSPQKADVSYGASRGSAVQLDMPASRSFSPTEQEPEIVQPSGGSTVLKESLDEHDDSFMGRPPSFKKKPPKDKSKPSQPAAVQSGDFSRRIKQLLSQFSSIVLSIKSKDVPDFVLEKVHQLAHDIDFYLQPYLSSIEGMNIDGILGIEESPGNFAFHQMSDDEKEAHCARWIAGQVAAGIRAAEEEIGTGGISSEVGEVNIDSADPASNFPFAECVHMASSMAAFLKENPVNWMFCASVLRRVESKRFPGKKLATYLYAPRPSTPEPEADSESAIVQQVALEAIASHVTDETDDSNAIDENPVDEVGSSSTSVNAADEIFQKSKLKPSKATGPVVETDERKLEFEDKRDHLQHASPVIRGKPESLLPTPPDDHTLTAKKGIEIFERSISNISDHGEKRKPAEDTRWKTTPRDALEKTNMSSSFMDLENDIMSSPAVPPRRRSNTGASSTAEDPSDSNAPVGSLKSLMADNASLRGAVGNAQQDSERPSSRNSVQSAVTDDAAAGDVFSRMNNLKSRISNKNMGSIGRSGTIDSNDDDTVSPRRSKLDSSPVLSVASPQKIDEDMPSVSLVSDSPVDIEEKEIPEPAAMAALVVPPKAQSPTLQSQSLDLAAAGGGGEKEMTAVERLKARLAKKGSDKSLSSLDRAPSSDSPTLSVANSAKIPEPVKEISSPAAAHTPSISSNKKGPRVPLRVDASAEEVPVTVTTPSAPTPLGSASTPFSATSPLVPTPRRGENVGSFSEAIAQALPSPSTRGAFAVGVSPPQKILGGVHPASPGGRLLYRPVGASSPAARVTKTFDFLDTVLNTIEQAPSDQDEDSESTSLSPLQNVNVAPLTEKRRSLHNSPTSGEVPPSPVLSMSPGSLDDCSAHDDPSPGLTHSNSKTLVPGGIASMGKKSNVELKRSQTTPVRMPEEKASVQAGDSTAKPPIIQKAASASLTSALDEAMSETSSIAGSDAVADGRPGKLSKKSSFSKSMKSMFGMGKKK